MKRLHVVGCPRSGTTLLMEMLSACFHFDGRCSHEASVFSPLPDGPGIFLSKQPTDVILLHRILDRDPDLFVIYVYRDPRSVMTSKHLSSKNYFANYVIWKRCEAAARKLSGHVRMLEMRYEDLIMKPTLSQERIQESFGFLKRTQSFADFDRNLTVSADAARAMNGLRSLDSNCLHKWKTHLPRVKDQLLRFPSLQDDIEYRAYENDSSWQKIMDGVEAIPYSCRYGQPAPLKELEKCIRLWFKTKRYLQRLESIPASNRGFTDP